MATAISGTSITFNDATVQTTAASGSTTFDAIGSVGYFLYYSAGTTNLTAGNTIAGSSLYYVSTIVANVTDQLGLITNGSIASKMAWSAPPLRTLYKICCLIVLNQTKPLEFFSKRKM